MADSVFAFFSGLPLNWIVFFASAIPITELRAAIPFGIASGMNPLSVWFWGVLGNLLPIPFILLLWPAIYKLFDKFPFTRGVLHHFVDKALEKGRTVENQGIIGLAIFVGIPLPMTGVWMGSLISFLLSLKPLRATAALTLGAMISGTIVTFASVGFINLAGFFGLLEAIIATLLPIIIIYLVYRTLKRKKKNGC